MRRLPMASVSRIRARRPTATSPQSAPMTKRKAKDASSEEGQTASPHERAEAGAHEESGKGADRAWRHRDYRGESQGAAPVHREADYESQDRDASQSSPSRCQGSASGYCR